MKQIQKGFTLIELMIVVAIIGILAAVAIPAYQDYIVKSKLSTVSSSLDSTKMALASYYQTYGGFPATAGTVTTATSGATAGLGTISAPDAWFSVGFTTFPTLPTASSGLTYTSSDGTPGATTLTLTLDKIRVGSVNGVFLTLKPTASSTAFTWTASCATGGASLVGATATTVDTIVKNYFGC